MGYFFDGKQSDSFEAHVSLTPEGILINYSQKENPIEILWPFSDLQLITPLTAERAALFALKNTDTRLSISENHLYDAILAHVLSHNILSSTIPHSWPKMGLLIISSLVILVIMFWGVPFVSPYLARWIPYSWDNRLGQYALETLINQNEECVSPAGLKALNKIIARLTASLPPTEPPFNIKVLAFGEDEINAFTVPGYHIILMDGLLHFATSPEEVAGVLAHEMGHAIEHHPTEGLIRQTGMQAIIVAAFGLPFEPATHLFHLQYSRGEELVADETAVRLLVNAHINTKGFLYFFNKLKKEYGDRQEETSLLSYLSTHPSHQERIERIQTQLLLMKTQSTSLLTPTEWQALKKICQKTKPFTP